MEQINILIEESTKEVEEKSLKKLRETYMSVRTKQNLSKGMDPKDFKWQDMINEVDNMYYHNKARYRYGKTVLGVLCAKIQKELGYNIELTRRPILF